MHPVCTEAAWLWYPGQVELTKVRVWLTEKVDDNFQVDELLVTIVFDQSAGDHCEEQVEAAPHEAAVS